MPVGSLSQQYMHDPGLDFILVGNGNCKWLFWMGLNVVMSQGPDTKIPTQTEQKDGKGLLPVALSFKGMSRLLV